MKATMENQSSQRKTQLFIAVIGVLTIAASIVGYRFGYERSNPSVATPEAAVEQSEGEALGVITDGAVIMIPDSAALSEIAIAVGDIVTWQNDTNATINVYIEALDYADVFNGQLTVEAGVAGLYRFEDRGSFNYQVLDNGQLLQEGLITAY